MTAIEEDRARWARIDRALGLEGVDPLRGHRPCALCAQRGPLVPAWQRMAAAKIEKLDPAERLRVSSTLVCADGCPPAG